MRAPHDDEHAWVLHTHAYRETSLIVEAFGRSAGRVALVARGAKRPRSELRGLLQAFQPLTLAWSGTGELKTLVKAEWSGGTALPAGAALLSAFYVNELVLKLLPREDPHPALWDAYAGAISALGADRDPAAQAVLLRGFELTLLAELGYAMILAHDAESGAPIDPQRRYHYAIDRGPLSGAARPLRAAEPAGSWPEVRGSTLIALASGSYPDPDTASEAKRLMRRVLDHHLEHRRIFSRRIVQDLAALDDGDDER